MQLGPLGSATMGSSGQHVSAGSAHAEKAVEHHFQSDCPSRDEDGSSDTNVDGRIDINMGQVREDALTIEQALQFLGASTCEKLPNH